MTTSFHNIAPYTHTHIIKNTYKFAEQVLCITYLYAHAHTTAIKMKSQSHQKVYGQTQSIHSNIL